ncbi:kinase domain protein [Ancylostoma caninum]|uniref:Serine/threonine-protein kinase 1 n=1 Tax=Ancylostoma caninum TaxID=29170 RepID=A0A368GT48_ANCCA|nr:kinase domain protein [Ancylostoma caninum]
MLKRKLQDLTVCCSYQVDFLHQKAHSAKEFRRQYTVLEEIGRGGFGIVYRAVRIADNLPVAVKFVEHKHVREWTMTCNQLIPSEVCHLETCKDVPGVIRLIDWFANSKGFLIVMERPENCMDIFDLISTYGRLDEDSARAIFIQVVDSVCTMYAKHGLIHRDIKDENLIVNMTTGEVKLVDFGATASAEKAMKKEFQGTRSYCPPEWFRQLQYLPLEATSWSLGVLLFILVTGQLPFKNEIQICLGRVKFPSYLSKALAFGSVAHLLLRAMTSPVSKRLSQDVLHKTDVRHRKCCQLIKSCLTTAAGSRAALTTIRQHPWLNKKIPIHTETFEAVLDRTLGRAQAQERSPRTPAEEARGAVEEERQINDVILIEALRSDRKSSNAPVTSRDAESTCTMVTANVDEESAPLVPRTRLHSKYDNISSSSLADYLSTLSVDAGSPEGASMTSDSVSVATTATTNVYFSTYDISEEEEAESSVSDVKPPVKSVSAYNLAARARKRSLIFKSFDRELDTVLEHTTPEHIPRVMTSSTDSEDQTVTEDSKPQQPEIFHFSRHRPLHVVADMSLAIFQAAPRPSLTTVV